MLLGVLVLGAVAAIAFSATASDHIDRASARRRSELQAAFGDTTLADVRALEEQASLGGDREERILADFLASAGAGPFVFRRIGTGYVARWRVQVWGQERLVEVRWTRSGTTVHEA